MMAGRWYGPRGDCGCCLPPVVPCDCFDGGDCVPANPGYYRNLAVEISEIPDEIFRAETTITNPCTTRACRPTESLTNYLENRYLGMSQFNGTYPILFYQYDADNDEYVEASPRSGCGFWGAASVTKTVRHRRIRQAEFGFSGINPPCNEFDYDGELTFDLTFDVFLNAVGVPTFPIPAPPGWNDLELGPRTSPLMGTLPSALITRRFTRKLSACLGGAVVETSDTVNTNDPIHRRSLFPSYYGGLINDEGVSRRVTPPGIASGLPSLNFPPGVTIRNSAWCAINTVESLIEYEEYNTSTIRTAACAESIFSTWGPWKIRRKLIFDGA